MSHPELRHISLATGDVCCVMKSSLDVWFVPRCAETNSNINNSLTILMHLLTLYFYRPNRAPKTECDSPVRSLLRSRAKQVRGERLRVPLISPRKYKNILSKTLSQASQCMVIIISETAWGVKVKLSANS